MSSMPPPPVGGSTPETTCTWNVAVAVLPDGSVAVQLTVVVPVANIDPEAGVHVIVTVPLLSAADGTVYVTLPELAPGGNVTRTLAGGVIVGSSSSTTCTAKLADAVLPTESVAVQLTVVVPIGKNDPDAGVQPAAAGPGPGEEAARRDDARRVQEALGTLDEEFREAVVLRDLDGLSYEEIAEATGAPVGTVRSRIHRGRAVLRERLLAEEPRRAGGAR